MSQDKDESGKEQKDASKPSITFDVFEAYYKTNPDLDNAEYYQAFPSINAGTIRSWKAKAKINLKTLPAQTPQTPSKQGSESASKDDVYLKELIEHLKIATRIDPRLLEGLDQKSQYVILKNANEQKKPDPNMRLFTPAGGESQRLGIEKYLKIDEKTFREKGHGDIELILPASVMFNPEESKKLKKYN